MKSNLKNNRNTVTQFHSNTRNTSNTATQLCQYVGKAVWQYVRQYVNKLNRIQLSVSKTVSMLLC